MDADLSDCVALSALYAMIKVRKFGKDFPPLLAWGKNGQNMRKHQPEDMGKPIQKHPGMEPWEPWEPWEAEREQKGFSVKEHLSAACVFGVSKRDGSWDKHTDLLGGSWDYPTDTFFDMMDIQATS